MVEVVNDQSDISQPSFNATRATQHQRIPSPSSNKDFYPTCDCLHNWFLCPSIHSDPLANNSLPLIIQNLAVNSTSEKFDQAIKIILLSPLLLQSETEKSSSYICGSYVTVMHTQNERSREFPVLPKQVPEWLF